MLLAADKHIFFVSPFSSPSTCVHLHSFIVWKCEVLKMHQHKVHSVIFPLLCCQDSDLQIIRYIFFLVRMSFTLLCTAEPSVTLTVLICAVSIR